MHDPWDVTATRRSDQYISCMRLSGVPLLPPVLSKECRKEMQYYRALALEVEKRVSFLKTLKEDSDSSGPIVNSGALPTDIDATENDPSLTSCKEKNSIKNVPDENDYNCPISDETNLVSNGYESMRSDITVIDTSDAGPALSSPKLVIGVIGDIFKDKINNQSYSGDIDDTPERDYNCISNKPVTKVDGSSELENMEKEKKELRPAESIIIKEKSIPSTITFPTMKDYLPKPMGPSSLSSSKSFDDIHAELSSPPKLVRQRSYTILKPSAALLAHLEVQSLTSGVEMSSISMSESCSNLSWLSRKRRSWDLETAKVKWSSMANELNRGVKNYFPLKRTHVARPNVRAQMSQKSPIRARPAKNEKVRRSSVPSSRSPYLSSNGSTMKSAPKTPRVFSPVRRATTEPKPDINKITTPIVASISSKKTAEKSGTPNYDFTAKLSMITTEKSQSHSPSPVKRSGRASPVREDPSTSIRELYEKIQNQQFIRMASLIEKQKKEQLMLQQVFEEQNSLFYKQLKTICPKSPNEIKEAWSEKPTAKDSHPVSLSQLINPDCKPTDVHTSVVSATLDDTQNYIHKTDEVLKRSRNFLNGIKGTQTSTLKPKPKSADHTTPCVTPQARPKSVPSSIPRRDDKPRTITDSSTRPRHLSPRKRLNSDSSQSSRDLEPILTDRTNDTMADLNFTLTSDDNVEFYPEPLSREYNMTFIKNNDETDHNVAMSRLPQSPISVSQKGKSGRSGSVDSNIESDQTLRDYSVQSPRSQVYSERRTVRKLFADRHPTTQQREAASRIVASAKGYLVRRLLRTERVQATVQTIRDALVCALQLHQDRDGIRGADIDLHRRLIQQITAACYSLHDTFIASSPRGRCALIAQDRERQKALEVKHMSGSYSAPRTPTAAAPPRRLSKRKSDRDVMCHSHSGVFVGRPTRAQPHAMTQSSHEMYSGEDKYRQTSKKSVAASKELHARRPWR